jgi:hypothetical protein
MAVEPTIITEGAWFDGGGELTPVATPEALTRWVFLSNQYLKWLNGITSIHYSTLTFQLVGNRIID